MSAYNIAQYWIFSALIILMAFIPGFYIASKIRFLTLIEKFVISFGVGFFVIILFTPLIFLNAPISRYLFLVLALLSLFLILKMRINLMSNKGIIFLSGVLLLNFASKFFLQTIWEYPVMGGDWFGHGFQIPYNLSMGDWTPPRDRPPFFNILILSYHNLLGTSLYDYWVTQLVSTVANSILFLPAYLIGTRLFSEKIAKVSVLFMMVTPYIVENSIYPWPKNFAAYFILLMIYFLFFRGEGTKGEIALAGVFGGLGFLIHNYAAVFITTTILIVLYQNRNKNVQLYIKNLNRSNIFYFICIFVLIISPYLVWIYSSYGTIFTSNFKYYPFAVKGYDSALEDAPEVVFQSFYSTPVWELLWIRFSNVLVTLFPISNPLNPYIYSFPSYIPAVYYNQSYAGMLSFGMYILVALWFYRFLRGITKTNSVILVLIVLPFLFHVFLWGWVDWGLHFMSFPTNPFLIMLGFNELYKYGKFKNIQYLVFIIGFIETLIYGKFTLDLYNKSGAFVGLNRELQELLPGFQLDTLISAHFFAEPNNYLNILITLFILFAGMLILNRKNV